MRHIVKSRQSSQKEKKKSNLKRIFEKGFVQIPNLEAIKISLPLGAFKTLCYLKMRMEEEDSCYPRQQIIAADTSIPLRSVERYIALLKKKRILTIRRGGRKNCNTYIARVRCSKMFRMMSENKEEPAKSGGLNPPKVAGSRIEEDSSKKIYEKNGIRGGAAEPIETIIMRRYADEADVPVNKISYKQSKTAKQWAEWAKMKHLGYPVRAPL